MIADSGCKIKEYTVSGYGLVVCKGIFAMSPGDQTQIDTMLDGILEQDGEEFGFSDTAFKTKDVEWVNRSSHVGCSAVHFNSGDAITVAIPFEELVEITFNE